MPATPLLAHATLPPESVAALLGSTALIAAGTALRAGRSVEVGRSRALRWVAVATLAGLAFQLGHTVEHVVQVLRWSAAPADPAYLSPIATAAVDALPGGRATATELLHLLGNGVFYATAIGLHRWASAVGAGGRAAGLARRAQALHLVEHVALTVTAVALGTPMGLTTGFGTLTGGTLTATRVLAHGTINVGVTLLAVGAVAQVARSVSRRP